MRFSGIDLFILYLICFFNNNCFHTISLYFIVMFFMSFLIHLFPLSFNILFFFFPLFVNTTWLLSQSPSIMIARFLFPITFRHDFSFFFFHSSIVLSFLPTKLLPQFSFHFTLSSRILAVFFSPLVCFCLHFTLTPFLISLSLNWYFIQLSAFNSSPFYLFFIQFRFSAINH